MSIHVTHKLDLSQPSSCFWARTHVTPVYLYISLRIPWSKEGFLITKSGHFLESWVPWWASGVRSSPGVGSPAGSGTMPVLMGPSRRGVIVAGIIYWWEPSLLFCPSWHILLTVVWGKVPDFQRHILAFTSPFSYLSILSTSVFWNKRLFSTIFFGKQETSDKYFSPDSEYQGRRAGHTLFTFVLLQLPSLALSSYHIQVCLLQSPTSLIFGRFSPPSCCVSAVDLHQSAESTTIHTCNLNPLQLVQS